MQESLSAVRWSRFRLEQNMGMICEGLKIRHSICLFSRSMRDHNYNAGLLINDCLATSMAVRREAVATQMRNVETGCRCKLLT